MSTANITYDYGFNFEENRKNMAAREERTSKVESKRAAIIRRDKKATVAAVLIIGVLLLGAIVISAYTANIQYQNNLLIAENEELQDDIDMLNIKIQTATNISTVEKIATDKYGMVYPDSTQYIYIDDNDTPGSKFASAIKEQVYN